MHPIPVREGDLTVESNLPPRLGLGPAFFCQMEPIQSAADPGLQQFGIGRGGPFYCKNLVQTQPELYLLLSRFLCKYGFHAQRGIRSPKGLVDCRVVVPNERELSSSIARLSGVIPQRERERGSAKRKEKERRESEARSDK